MPLRNISEFRPASSVWTSGCFGCSRVRRFIIQLYSVENATNRRNTVLQNMWLPQALLIRTADQAAAVGIGGQLMRIGVDYRYPSYFDAVINEAVNDYGFTKKRLLIMAIAFILN